MRILITSDIFPPDVGGPATYVPRIAAELTQRGHQVTVVTYSLVQSDAADCSYPFPVVRVSAAPPRWRRLPRTLSAIVAHGRNADIIYANGLITESVLANYVLRKPIVAKVVGDLAWERSRDKGWIQDDIERFQVRRYSLKVELMRWRRSLSYAHMDSIIVPSRYLKEMVVGYWHLPADRVQVVYNSFEVATASRRLSGEVATASRASATAPRVSGTPPRALGEVGGVGEMIGQEVPAAAIDLPVKYKLITVCRLTGWKGVDGLIQALPALPDVGLVIVGDGPLSAELHALALKLGVDGRVLFAGTVPKKDVSAYLRACDLFVLNSTYEGMPHVILEAMAAGRPVVATAVGGSGEIIEDGVNGLLVPPGEPLALQQALLRMLNNPTERLNMVQKSQDTLNRFDLECIVDQTEDVLSRAVQAKKASRHSAESAERGSGERGTEYR
jgi:glycosyltransferase involved in cell wall biosynthesis